MTLKFARAVGAFALAIISFAPALSAGQTPATPAPAAPPPQEQPAGQRAAIQPPAGSGPLVRVIELRFEPVNESLIEPQTYLYYIQTQASRPSDGVWVPFTETTEQTLL